MPTPPGKKTRRKIDRYRVEVSLSPATKKRLNELRKEFKDKTGNHIAMSGLISNIIDAYLERIPGLEIE